MKNSLIKREHDSIFQTYKRLPIVVDHAEGARITDVEGNVYLDFLGGIAVNALGHSHPKIIEAINNQIKKYIHLSNYFYQEPQVLLAEKLKSISGYDRVFFSNSGTEANEGAIKLARRWGYDKEKTHIIGFTGGFHGRTYGTLSLMDKPLYKEKMGPFLPNMRMLQYNNIQALIGEINDFTCAIIIEFIQGEGGITSAENEFIDKIFDLKKKFGFLVIADEIQCGTGRTGKFFGFNHYDVSPDIVTMAKGIGGGLPLGAILAKEELAKVWEKGMHGTTYGGNALACTTGLVVLEELDNGLMTHVSETGHYFTNMLKRIQKEFPTLIYEVRGIGLMQGLLLSFDANELVNALLEKKIITNAASGKVLRLVPPLIITKDDVNELIDTLRQCLNNFNK